MGGWAYLLRCADESYYAGSTSLEEVEARVWDNNGVYGGYTASRRAVSLVWAECEDLRDAHITERRLKGWSRAKKEALIARDYTRIQLLAKRPSARSAWTMGVFDTLTRHADTKEVPLNRHPEVRVSRAKLGTRASKE
jgi:putative endonuclease